jgi:hypothetical protein
MKKIWTLDIVWIMKRSFAFKVFTIWPELDVFKVLYKWACPAF